jgi:hypothetical protein
MAEPVTHDNPLRGDPVLFDMYMSELDAVLADPEIREALEEFNFSRHRLRAGMVTTAREVLAAAQREFTLYEEAKRRYEEALNSETEDSNSRYLYPDELGDFSRNLAIVFGVIGVVFIAAGTASIAVWRLTEPLVWAGATVLAVAALIWALRPFRGALIRVTGPELDPARNALMVKISSEQLMAQARTLINMARQDHFGHEYSVSSISGLSEIYDTTYQVPTSTAAELDDLLTRLDGASVGIAGPRGSGKSTLIRGYCDEGTVSDAKRLENGWSELPAAANQPAGAVGDLRCMVSAPVDYAARDFVLHLFAIFCRNVIRLDDSAKSPRSFRTHLEKWLGAAIDILVILLVSAVIMGIAIVFLHWQHSIARFFHVPAELMFFVALALVLLVDLKLILESTGITRRARMRMSEHTSDMLVSKARLHLDRVRYLQTYTSGWSGTLSLPGGEAQHSRGHSRAEQPLSYPEIVAEFRTFARDVAAEVHRAGGRVFIGIDELDKIGAPENVERFLNEIKGIFGIPYLYFMVSVSDDALTAFERRGLPLRDAFDSSFDEIIHMGPLSYTESRRLLYRRVIGLTEPYIALCHCLAGGLARDLIRAARQVTRVGETLMGHDQSILSEDSETIIESLGTYRVIREARTPQTPTIGVVCAAVVRDGLNRKARAVAHVANSNTPDQTQELQDALYDIRRHLVSGTPMIKIVDIACQTSQGESAAAMRGLRT